MCVLQGSMHVSHIYIVYRYRYVCMYVRMYVRTYVRMYVCTYVHTYVRKYMRCIVQNTNWVLQGPIVCAIHLNDDALKDSMWIPLLLIEYKCGEGAFAGLFLDILNTQYGALRIVS